LCSAALAPGSPARASVAPSPIEGILKKKRARDWGAWWKQFFRLPRSHLAFFFRDHASISFSFRERNCGRNGVERSPSASFSCRSCEVAPRDLGTMVKLHWLLWVL
jgi:hypothetical protein